MPWSSNVPALVFHLNDWIDDAHVLNEKRPSWWRHSRRGSPGAGSPSATSTRLRIDHSLVNLQRASDQSRRTGTTKLLESVIFRANAYFSNRAHTPTQKHPSDWWHEPIQKEGEKKKKLKKCQALLKGRQGGQKRLHVSPFFSVRCLVCAPRAGEAFAVDSGIRLKEDWKSFSLWLPVLSVAATGIASLGDKQLAHCLLLISRRQIGEHEEWVLSGRTSAVNKLD